MPNCRKWPERWSSPRLRTLEYCVLRVQSARMTKIIEGKMESTHPPASQAKSFLAVLLAAVALVAALSLLTNRMAARWDMKYYLDMATNGIAGNHHLATPFAYRPVVPLTIYAISHTLHTDPEATFHVATHVIAVVLLVLAFYFTRSFGGSPLASWCGLLFIG